MIFWFNMLPTFHLINAVGLTMLVGGFLLSKHRDWLNGELELTDTSLEISGELKISILFERLDELYNFKNNSNRMGIKSTLYNSLIINFETETEQRRIMERLKKVI